MKYKTIIDRINAAVKENKGKPGVYVVSLEGKLLFGFAGEDSKDNDAPERDLRKKGYDGNRLIYHRVLNPKKRYIFSAA